MCGTHSLSLTLCDTRFLPQVLSGDFLVCSDHFVPSARNSFIGVADQPFFDVCTALEVVDESPVLASLLEDQAYPGQIRFSNKRNNKTKVLYKHICLKILTNWISNYVSEEFKTMFLVNQNQTILVLLFINIASSLGSNLLKYYDWCMLLVFEKSHSCARLPCTSRRWEIKPSSEIARNLNIHSRKI